VSVIPLHSIPQVWSCFLTIVIAAHLVFFLTENPSDRQADQLHTNTLDKGCNVRVKYSPVNCNMLNCQLYVVTNKQIYNITKQCNVEKNKKKKTHTKCVVKLVLMLMLIQKMIN